MAAVGQARLAHLRLNIPPVYLGVTVSLPRLQVEQELPAVRVDLRRPMEELLGLERHLTLARRAAQQGHRAALRATAEKAREGDLLREFQWGIDVVDIAKAQGQPRQKELNVDIAPKSRVKIQVEPGRVEARLEPGQVHVEVPFRLVEVDLEPATHSRTAARGRGRGAAPWPKAFFPGKPGQEKRGRLLDTYG